MPTRIDTRPVGARKWIAPVTTLQVQSCSISDSVASGEVPPRPKRKRSKGQSPTARTLAVCRKRGWEAQAVERFNSYTKQRIDLFGVIDIVAITPAGILRIQACVGGDHAKRMKKALDEPRLHEWLKHAQFAVWSWAKQGARGKRKLWTLREEEVKP